MADVLSHKRFQDEEAAYEWVEAHLWPNGPVCPRCEGMDRIRKLQGKSTRIGTYYCNACRKPFTVNTSERFLRTAIFPLQPLAPGDCASCAQARRAFLRTSFTACSGITLKSVLVHVSPHSRGHADRWPCSDGRTRVGRTKLTSLHL